MDDEALRESRRILRRVQDHLLAAHTHLGAQRESAALVEIIYHATSAVPSLNYVTPRRSTAWVPAEMVQQGMARLRGHGRVPRVQYIEGLYPPQFSAALRDLGLRAEYETPLMIYVTAGFTGKPAPPVTLAPLPDGVSVVEVTDQRGIELWWYVWRNAHYDVLTLGAEPLLVGRDLAAVTLGHQLDVLLYRAGFPTGVARLSIHSQGAHLLGMALMKEARTPDMLRVLTAAATRAALDQGCDLVYAPGETEADRQTLRALGFLDFGSVVRYAPADASTGNDSEAHNDRILGQPVLTLR
mgnify:CR=1 FL=1